MTINNQSIPLECECCPSTQIQLQSREPKQSLRVFMGMWLCPTCEYKERELQKVNNNPQLAEERVLVGRALVEHSRAIDLGIIVREDVFNANPTPTIEIKNAIYSDSSIPDDKKAITYGERIFERYSHLQKVIYDARVLLVEAGNEQRAIQSEMNTLANQLRAEERQRLQLQDINYKPDIVKPIKIRTSGERKSKGKKFDKTELVSLAAQYNVPMELIQLTATVRNMSPTVAAIHLSQQMSKAENK